MFEPKRGDVFRCRNGAGNLRAEAASKGTVSRAWIPPVTEIDDGWSKEGWEAGGSYYELFEPDTALPFALVTACRKVPSGHMQT